MVWREKQPTRRVATRTAIASRVIGSSSGRLDQSLLVRGHRDFGSRDEYTVFLHGVAAKQNAGRSGLRFAEEIPTLRTLALSAVGGA